MRDTCILCASKRLNGQPFCVAQILKDYCNYNADTWSWSWMLRNISSVEQFWYQFPENEGWFTTFVNRFVALVWSGPRATNGPRGLFWTGSKPPFLDLSRFRKACEPVHVEFIFVCSYSHYGSVTLLWANRFKTRNMCLSWAQERCVLMAFAPKWMHFWVEMFGCLSRCAYPNKLIHKVQLRLCMQVTLSMHTRQQIIFFTFKYWILALGQLE